MYKLLNKQISECDTCILYQPMANELDCNEPAFPIQLPINKIYLPQNKNSNPFEISLALTEELKNRKVFLLIPGTKFDSFGTRHGRGGGWYDRFLSKVPSHWIRIGVIDSLNFSEIKIERKKWDQEMDWIIVKNKFIGYGCFSK